MNRFATSLLLKPVVLDKEKAIVGVASEIVIDPASGSLVGFIVKEGFGKKHEKALAVKDLIGVGKKFLIIKSYSVLGELDEIVRVKTVREKGIQIIKNKVFTVSGKYLGRVMDFTIDVELGQLTRLYVSPGLLGAIKSQLIISFQQIISIEKNKITVEDACVKAKSTMKAVASRETEAV